MGIIDEFVNSKSVKDCFRDAVGVDPSIGPVRGLIVPHAGYIYSGSVAASGYKLLNYQLRITNYELVKIIGFYHSGDKENEHSVKVQIPLIRYVLGKVKIEEIYTDEILDLEVDSKTLVVASSDLSHYLPEEVARKVDERTIKAILSKDEEKIKREADACGLMPILTINRLANKYGWKAELVDYRTSGEVAGDYSAVVGYGCVAYFDL